MKHSTTQHQAKALAVFAVFVINYFAPFVWIWSHRNYRNIYAYHHKNLSDLGLLHNDKTEYTFELFSECEKQFREFIQYRNNGGSNQYTYNTRSCSGPKDKRHCHSVTKKGHYDFDISDPFGFSNRDDLIQDPDHLHDHCTSLANQYPNYSFSHINTMEKGPYGINRTDYDSIYVAFDAKNNLKYVTNTTNSFRTPTQEISDNHRQLHSFFKKTRILSGDKEKIDLLNEYKVPFLNELLEREHIRLGPSKPHKYSFPSKEGLSHIEIKAALWIIVNHAFILGIVALATQTDRGNNETIRRVRR